MRQDGCLAAYNPEKNIRLSPALDGPIRFTHDTNNKNVPEPRQRQPPLLSTVRVPYCLKLSCKSLP